MRCSPTRTARAVFHAPPRALPPPISAPRACRTTGERGCRRAPGAGWVTLRRRHCAGCWLILAAGARRGTAAQGGGDAPVPKYTSRRTRWSGPCSLLARQRGARPRRVEGGGWRGVSLLKTPTGGPCPALTPPATPPGTTAGSGLGVDARNFAHNQTAGEHTSPDGAWTAISLCPPLLPPRAAGWTAPKQLGCPSTTAHWGGWAAEGKGVTLRGTWGRRRRGGHGRRGHLHLLPPGLFVGGGRAGTVVRVANPCPADVHPCRHLWPL